MVRWMLVTRIDSALEDCENHLVATNSLGTEIGKVTDLLFAGGDLRRI